MKKPCGLRSVKQFIWRIEEESVKIERRENKRKPAESLWRSVGENGAVEMKAENGERSGERREMCGVKRERRRQKRKYGGWRETVAAENGAGEEAWPIEEAASES